MLHLFALVAAPLVSAPFAGTIVYDSVEDGAPAEQWTATITKTSVALVQPRGKRFVGADGHVYAQRGDHAPAPVTFAGDGVAVPFKKLADRKLAGRVARCLSYTPKTMPAFDEKHPPTHVELCVFLDERSVGFGALGLGMSEVDSDAVVAAAKLKGIAASMALMSKQKSLASVTATKIDATPPPASTPVTAAAFFQIEAPDCAAQAKTAGEAAANAVYIAEEGHHAEHDTYVKDLGKTGFTPHAHFSVVVEVALVDRYVAVVTGSGPYAGEQWRVEGRARTQVSAAKCR